MTAVRSLGKTTAAMNALRGATSICARELLSMRNVSAGARPGNTGMSARKIAEGRCVNTIVFTSPILLEIDTAARLLRAVTRLVVKNMVPSVLWSTENVFAK